MSCARVSVFFAAGVGSLISALAANADPATYIYTGVTSGTLAGVGFSDRAITITGHADTINRFGALDFWLVTHDSATIAIEGFGVLNVTTATSTAVNSTSMISVFGNVEEGSALYVQGPADVFSTWDLTTSLGPLDLAGRFLQWSAAPLQTSAGELRLDNQLGVLGTFQAIVVPAPGAAALAGLAGMIGLRRRR